MIDKEQYLQAKELVEKYEEQQRMINAMRVADCYYELKSFLQKKKESKRLCDWDDVHHQEIWDKMFELEKKHFNI